MRLFLIRHGETEHNVAGLLAGVTDSRLTNHGVLQAERLATHLVIDINLQFTSLFASDLRRAYETAGKIATTQNASENRLGIVEVVRLSLLREQDFGSLELVSWSRAKDSFEQVPSPSDPGFVPKETYESMKARADTFLDDYLFPLLAIDHEEESCIAVVSHGLFLAAIWKALLARFRPGRVSLAPHIDLPRTGQPLEFLPSWSNTGYLDLQIRMLAQQEDSMHNSPGFSDKDPGQPEMLAAAMTVQTINGKDHLVALKRTRGGVGSSAHDGRQQKLDGFFKKPQVE